MIGSDKVSSGGSSSTLGQASDAYPLLARLQMVAAACADSMSLDELVSVALGQGVGSVGAAGAVIYLCRHDGLSLAGDLGIGSAAGGWELLPYDEILPLTDALREEEAVWLPTARDKEQRYPALAALHSGFDATASLPLVAGDVRLGTLGVAFSGEHVFSSAEQLFLLALADLIASALGHLADRRTAGSSSGWASLADPGRLAEVQRLRAAGDRSRTTLDRFARLAAAVCGAPLAHVSLVERDRVVVGSHGDGPLGADMPFEESLCLVTASAAEPVVADDAINDVRIKALSSVASGEIGAYLGVPIMSGEHVVGALCVVDPSPREWPPTAVDRLADVAAGIGDALDVRVRVGEQAQALDRVSRLRRLREALVGTRSTAEVAEVVVDHLVQLPSAAGAAFVRWADVPDAATAGVVDTGPARGLDGDAVSFAAGVVECLRSGQPVRAPDLVAVMVQFRELMPDMVILGTRAVLAWPVRAGRGGAVVLAVPDGRRVSAESEGLLDDMCMMAGQHLDRIDLTQHEEHLRAEMAFLVEASSQLDLGLDTEQTLTRAARIAVPGLAGRCVVHLLDGDSLRPVAVAHVDAGAEPALWQEQQRATHPSAEDGTAGFGLADQVVATGRTAVRAADPVRTDGSDSGWAMSVPLRARGRLLGVLSLARARHGPAGRPPRVSFVESLAARVAVAIDNVLLYHERDDGRPDVGPEASTALHAPRVGHGAGGPLPACGHRAEYRRGLLRRGAAPGRVPGRRRR